MATSGISRPTQAVSPSTTPVSPPKFTRTGTKIVPDEGGQQLPIKSGCLKGSALLAALGLSPRQ